MDDLYRKMTSYLAQLDKNSKEPKQWTVVMGYESKRILDLQIRFDYAKVRGRFNIKYFLHFYKKNLGFSYISLVRKEGLYKLRFYSDRKLPLHLYKGAELIFQTNDLGSINDFILKHG